MSVLLPINYKAHTMQLSSFQCQPLKLLLLLLLKLQRSELGELTRNKLLLPIVQRAQSQYLVVIDHKINRHQHKYEF